MIISFKFCVVMSPLLLTVQALQRYEEMTDCQSGHYILVYMEEECGGTIFMDDSDIPAGRLAVTRRSKYRSKFSCQLTIIAPEQQRLIVVFREMDIELEEGCDDDFVQFFDGPSKSSPMLPGLKRRLCGHKPAIGNYVTSGRTLTVYFQSDVYKQENGFEIIFTAFHTAPKCGIDEFRCANGRCIARSLECNDFNNCGDNSDGCEFNNEVLLALILSVFLVTIIAAGVFLVIRKKMKRSKLQKIKQALTGTLRVHPGYGEGTFTKQGNFSTCTCNKLSTANKAKVLRHCQNPVQAVVKDGCDLWGR